MSLRQVFRVGARTAFRAAGDVPASTNYLAFSSAGYNASAGSTVTIYATTTGVDVLIGNYRHAEIDGTRVRPQDRRISIPAITISALTPKPNDQVVAGSDVWTVIDVNTDPAQALWKLQVRKP